MALHNIDDGTQDGILFVQYFDVFRKVQIYGLVKIKGPIQRLGPNARYKNDEAVKRVGHDLIFDHDQVEHKAFDEVHIFFHLAYETKHSTETTSS